MAARRKSFNIERFLQALGDNTQLRLLNLIGDQEVCVCYFIATLGEPQPKISRHPAYLCNAGIVSARRESKWMHYCIAMSLHIGAAQIFRQTINWLKEDKAMQTDRARLMKACCSPLKYPALEGALLPIVVAEPCCEVSQR